MNSNLTFKFREAPPYIPDSDNPDDIPEPIIVPDTGTLTIANHPEANSSLNASIVSVSVILFVMVIAIIASLFKKRNHKIFSTSGTFRFNNKARTLSCLSILVLVFLLAIVPVTIHHTAKQADVSAASDDSLSVSVDDFNCVSEVPTEEANLYAFSRVKITSNTQAGYVLLVYADHPDLLPSKEDNDHKINSLGTNNLHGSRLELNTWGLAIEEQMDELSEVWYTMPNSLQNAKVLKNASEPTPANDETIVFYGVRVNENINPDSYSNVLHYVAIANQLPEPDPEYYTVVYDANGGEGNMSHQSAMIGEAITIQNNNFTYDKHTFNSWNTMPDGSGTTYSGGQTVPNGLTNAADSIITLYAQWNEVKTYMQEYTKEECQIEATNSPIILYDRRDGSDYTVRYINNTCIMTQNLRITKSTGQADWTISKTDSNFNNVDTWNIHVNDLTAGDSFEEARSHIADSSIVEQAIAEGYTTTLDGSSITPETFGVWYNFCAASANNNNGCNEEAEYAPDAGTITGDICPAGWHIPVLEEVEGLIGETSFGATNNATTFLPNYGYVSFDGYLSFKTVKGYWWLASPYTNMSQYYIGIKEDYLNTNNAGKDLAFNIRCVITE